MGLQWFRLPVERKLINLLENEYIDLAIVGIMMPVMDGFQLVEEMKEMK